MTDEHVGPEFDSEFPTWQEFRSFVADRARFPAFDVDRAMQQVLKTDLLARLDQGRGEWILKDSVGLPLRPPQDLPWPADFHAAGTEEIHPAYVMPRAAFDLDLYARAIAEGSASTPDPGPEYARQVQRSLHAVLAPERSAGENGLGLGGLVHYSLSGPLRVWNNGQVMGTITAQPVDRRFGARGLRPVDDPISLEIDVKPPAKIQFSGPPETGQRDLIAFPIPGFRPTRPLLHPLANQTADKACTLTGPPLGLRGQVGAWHRYKDLFDLYFIARTCRVDGDMLREAVEHNWNWQRIGHGMPFPYHVFGRKPGPAEEPEVPWRDACEQLRASQAQLAAYPEFPAMIDAVGAFVDGLREAQGAMWVPGQGWTRQPRQAAARAAQNLARRPTASPTQPTLGIPNSPQTPRPPTPQRNQQQHRNEPKQGL